MKFAVDYYAADMGKTDALKNQQSIVSEENKLKEKVD
jgi:hypothetical protein